VVATNREVLIKVKAGIRVRYRRSEPPPPYTYAITLEVYEKSVWKTVRLWDNADNVYEHHVHEYTRQGEKQTPLILQFNSVNEAMAAANDEARNRAQELVREWRQS
jgi:hypothetical protein